MSPAAETAGDVLWFRAMERGDLAAVRRMLDPDADYSWNDSQILDSLQAPHDESWLACERGTDRPVAYAVTQSVLDETQLLNFCVAGACRQRGFGRALLDFVLTRARERGQSRALLEVRASNLPAIRLYERAGFGRIAVRKDYYPAGEGREDACIYSLSLR